MSDNAMGHGFEPVNAMIAVVEGDLSCRRCNQRLTGLPIDGRCPQCGAPVGMTLNGELLRYAKPAWVRKLQAGCITMLSGMGMIFIVIGLTIVAVVVTQDQPLVARVSTVGNFLCSTVAAIGLWMLTTPQPNPIGEDELVTARKLIRFFAILGVLSAGVSIVGALPGVPKSFQEVNSWVTIGVGLAGLIGLAAQFQYIEHLASRIPDPPMSERADFLRIALPASQAILLVISGISRFVFTAPPATPPATPTMPSPAAIGVGCLSAIFGIATLVLTILFIILLVKFAIELGRQAKLAAENEAPAAVPPPSNL